MTEPAIGPPSISARLHLAWLIWCVSEGYVYVSDRATMINWLAEDVTAMHPADVELRANLLAMADEVLAALEAERA